MKWSHFTDVGTEARRVIMISRSHDQYNTIQGSCSSYGTIRSTERTFDISHIFNKSLQIPLSLKCSLSVYPVNSLRPSFSVAPWCPHPHCNRLYKITLRPHWCWEHLHTSPWFILTMICVFHGATPPPLFSDEESEVERRWTTSLDSRGRTGIQTRPDYKPGAFPVHFYAHLLWASLEGNLSNA